MMSILTGLWTIMLLAIAEHMFNKAEAIATGTISEDDHTRFLSLTGVPGWIQAVVIGALVWFANYFGSDNLGLSIAAFAVMVVIMAYLAWYFLANASRWRELILFVMLSVPLAFVLLQAGAGIAENGFLTETNPGIYQYISNTGAFWYSVFMILPWMILTAYAAILLMKVLFSKDSKVCRVLGLVTAILAILGVISMIIWGPNWGKLFEEEPATVEAPSIPVKETVPTPTPTPTSEPEPVVEEVAADWWYFYNTEMLADDNPKNDYDFGPFLLATMAMDSIKSGNYTLEDLANKSIDELIGLVSAEELHYAFWDRLTKDPALGAATAAWLDVKAGTRFLGEFYESCKENWATTINAAKVAWMNDQDAYYRTLLVMKKFLLTSAKSVEIIQVKGGLEDQMYMNPYTVDLVPDVIVMESAEQRGYFLRYTLDIKGKEIFVDFRVDCGFQPTNVAKLMKITPQKNPNKKDTGKTSGGGNKDKGKSSGGNTGKSSGGNTGKTSGGGNTSGGTTDTGYSGGYSGGGNTIIRKDDTKGFPKEEVANKHPDNPGPDTSNGVGAVESKAEEPTNSYYRAEQQFEKDLEELIGVDKGQRVGGDANTITAPVSSDTELVENATSNEFGDIDKAMPIHDTHLEGTNLGGSTSIQDDPLGDEMECPD